MLSDINMKWTPPFCLSILILPSSSIRFPEIRYFQDDDVRTKLTDILFCFARENEQLLYKQVQLIHCSNSPFTELRGLRPPQMDHLYLLLAQPWILKEDWWTTWWIEVNGPRSTAAKWIQNFRLQTLTQLVQNNPVFFLSSRTVTTSHTWIFAKIVPS